MSRSTIIYILIIGAFFLYGYINEAERDETGNIVSEGTIDAMEVKTGDCFNEKSEIFDDEATEVQAVTGIPCTESHDFEVYAVFDVSSGIYPGEDSMNESAQVGCVERFESFVGAPYDSSILAISFMYPTSETWTRMDDREIVCSLFNTNMEKLEGTMKGTGI